MQQSAGYPVQTFTTMQKQGIPRPPSPSYDKTKPLPTLPGQSGPNTGQGMPNLPGPGGAGNPSNPGTTIWTNMPAPTNGAAPGPGVSPIGAGMNPGQLPPGVAFGPGLTPIGPGMNPGQNIPDQPNGATQGPGTSPIGPGMGGAAPPPAQNPSNWGDLGNQLTNQWQQHQAPAPFTPGTNPFSQQMNQQLQQSIMGSLQNPSAYTSDMALGTYNMLNQRLGEDFNTSRQYLNEEMSKRGIDPSTIHGGRLSDLLTNQNRAQADLVHQLTTDAARQFQSDRSSAQGMGMGYQNQQYGQDLGAYQTNLGAQQQGFNQGQQKLENLLGFGQREFDNQMTVNNFNANQEQQLNALLMALMGGLG